MLPLEVVSMPRVCTLTRSTVFKTYPCYQSSLCLRQIESSLWLSSTSNIPEKAKSFTCSLRMIEIQSKTNKQTKQTNTHTHKKKHKTTKQTNEISYHGNLVWCRGCAIQCKARPSPRPIS